VRAIVTVTEPGAMRGSLSVVKEPVSSLRCVCSEESLKLTVGATISTDGRMTHA
jgi:hypothetical protein